MIENAGQFLALAKLKRGQVEVRGSVVHIRELSVAERAKLLELSQSNSVNTQVFLLRCGITNAEGGALFSEEQAKDLAEAAPEVVDAVALAVMRLSGLGDDEKNA